MTMATVPFFGPVPSPYNAGSQNTFAMDTTDDSLSFVFQWPGGDLTKCAIVASAAAGSPVVTAQVFNTDASDATTTPVNTTSPVGAAVDSVALVVDTPQAISGIGQSSLGAGIYAVRLIFKSGTSCSIRYGYGTELAASNVQFPMVVTVTNGGAQTRVANNGGLAIALGGSTFVPVLGTVPPTVITGNSFADTSNPDELGLWMINPYGVIVRVAGCYIYNGSNARPNTRLAFYTGSLSGGVVSAPSQVTTELFDRDLVVNPAANGWNFYQFGTKQTLGVGASCGIGIRSATTHNQTVYEWDWKTGNEAMMDAWLGQGFMRFAREADAGDLTVTSFKTPLIFPVFDGIDPGAGVSSVPLSRPTILFAEY